MFEVFQEEGVFFWFDGVGETVSSLNGYLLNRDRSDLLPVETGFFNWKENKIGGVKDLFTIDQQVTISFTVLFGTIRLNQLCEYKSENC